MLTQHWVHPDEHILNHTRTTHQFNLVKNVTAQTKFDYSLGGLRQNILDNVFKIEFEQHILKQCMIFALEERNNRVGFWKHHLYLEYDTLDTLPKSFKSSSPSPLWSQTFANSWYNIEHNTKAPTTKIYPGH